MLTDSQVSRLIRLNNKINAAKCELKEMLNAPVVTSIYAEEAEQYGDDEFILQRHEIYTIIPDAVAGLAGLCVVRKQILDTRHA